MSPVLIVLIIWNTFSADGFLRVCAVVVEQVGLERVFHLAVGEVEEIVENEFLKCIYAAGQFLHV